MANAFNFFGLFCHGFCFAPPQKRMAKTMVNVISQPGGKTSCYLNSIPSGLNAFALYISSFHFLWLSLILINNHFFHQTHR